MNDYGSPEEAARGDIPARYARAVAVSVSPEGRRACVLLLTNEEPRLYPYEVIVERDEHGRWRAGASSNLIGVGWTSTGVERDRGVLRLVAEVPPRARSATIRHGGSDHAVSVTEGWVLFAAWDVPAHAERPLVIDWH